MSIRSLSAANACVTGGRFVFPTFGLRGAARECAVFLWSVGVCERLVCSLVCGFV
jgi:hypothetical protein